MKRFVLQLDSRKMIILRQHFNQERKLTLSVQINSNRAIGVFDSGLGGLTAVRVLRKILPGEQIIYFGDTGRVPYGTRSDEIIKKYALDDMNFLSSFGVKAVLVACGTVSSVALDTLKENFDIPVMGVVRSACEKACALTKNKKVALLATPATVKNKAYEKECRSIDANVTVSGIGCPMFVPLVENGYISSDCTVTKLIADEYLKKLCEFSPDVIILGCTHYPIIRSIIEERAKEIIGDVSIVDSGEEAAVAMKNFISVHNLTNSDDSAKEAKFYVSDETQNFESAASLFLGEKINDITKIDIGSYIYKKL